MEAHGRPFQTFGALDHGYDLFQRHFRTVIEFTTALSIRKQFGIDQRTRVQDNVRRLQQCFPAQGDEIGGAAARSDKMYH